MAGEAECFQHGKCKYPYICVQELIDDWLRTSALTFTDKYGAATKRNFIEHLLHTLKAITASGDNTKGNNNTTLQLIQIRYQ